MRNFQKSAGLAHAEMRQKEKDFGLADSYVLATSRKMKTKILHRRHPFKKMLKMSLITIADSGAQPAL